MENTDFREDFVIEFNDDLDTDEGRNFIYKAVDFFVRRSMDKVKDSIPNPLETKPAHVYYEKYKFIYDRKDKANMELCHLLVAVASDYIDYIEDTFRAKLQFPFDYNVLFDLDLWFEEIDIKNRYTEEIMILLINRLYNTVYCELILA